MSAEGFSGVLDLSGANTKGFPVPDTGTWDAEFFDFEWQQTKGKTATNPDAKMPAGQPRLNVQLRIIQPPFENARCFTSYTIPPADYDADKKANMEGMLVRFLQAVTGLDEAKIKSKNFKITDALTDALNNPCRVTGKKVQKYGTDPEDNEWQFDVTGVKPPSSPGEARGGKLL